MVLLLFAFYITQWDVYFSGVMDLSYINVTEGQFVLMGIHLMGFVFGPEIYYYELPFEIPYFNTLNLSQAIVLLSMLSAVVQIITAAVNLIKLVLFFIFSYN